MSLTRRALLRIWRKKTMTIITFILLWLVFTFVLVCMDILNTTDTATATFRKSIGANISIKGTNDDVSTAPVTKDQVSDVMKVDVVLLYNAQSKMLLYDGGLEFTQGVDYENCEYKAWIVSNNYTEINSYFFDDQLALCSGRHIQHGDKNVAIISKDIADINYFEVGDYIWLKGVESDVTLEIVGLFQIKDYDSNEVLTCLMPENLIFTDISAYEQLSGEEEYNYGVTFYIEDPEMLEYLITEVKSINSIDWSGYTLTFDNSDYINIKTKLDSIKDSVLCILPAVCVAIVFMLILVFAFQIRNRLHEAGIYLSIGLSKLNIIGQFLMEADIISAAALLGSYLTGSIILYEIDSSFNSLLSQAKPITVAEANEIAIAATVSAGVVTFSETLLTILMLIISVNITVCIASSLILRLTPKSIFAEMN